MYPCVSGVLREGAKNRNSHKLQAALTALLCILALAPAGAKIIYVKPTGNDTLTGLTWDLAKATISAAISASATGDEIWVVAGTYNTRLSLKSGVALYGGFLGTETSRTQRNFNTNPTIIDGGAGGRVVSSLNGSTSTRLDGFRIRNGLANVGAGVYLNASSAVITDNIIEGNAGQGIGSVGPSTPTFTYNIIQNNSDSGIYASGSTPTISKSIIRYNKTVGFGGGIYLNNASATVENNTITGNFAQENGGAIRIYQCSPTVRSNLISWNTALSGGGIEVEFESSPIIVNNTIVYNSSTHRNNVGGIGLSTDLASTSSPVLTNNIVAFNSSGIRQADVLTTPTLSHNDVYGNYSFDYVGLPAGATDLMVNPGLRNLTLGDYHLGPASPLLNAGDDSAVVANSTDFEGDPRLIGAHVDIGADELSVTRPALTIRRVLYVKPTGNDANDGRTWATAKGTIQGAIAVSIPSDEIWVAAGTYSESLTLAPGVTLLGGFAGTETVSTQRNWTVNQTIVDGGGTGRVVYASYVGTTSGMDGFSIRNGNSTSGAGVENNFAAPVLNHMDIGPSQGIGLHCLRSAPYLLNSTVHDSTDSGVYADISVPTITNTVITKNASPLNGGGLFCSFSSPFITNCQITQNTAANRGGGVYCYRSSPEITATTIIDNSAATNGGAFYLDFSSPRITSCLVVGNTSDGTAGFKVYNSSNPYIWNCTIVGNNSTQPNRTGGISLQLSSSPIVANNIIAFNGGYGIRNEDATGTPSFIKNCLWNNTPANYSNQTAGATDFVADPQFIDLAGRNFHLKGTSPCVNAGDPVYIQVGETDIDRQPRIYGATVDVGADEKVPFGIYDFNGDGSPDILVVNSTYGRLSVLFMNGTSISAAQPIKTLLPTGNIVVGVGDMNGDGKADIIIQDPTTRQISVMLMNGVAVTSTYPVSPIILPGWMVKAVGDFDGDGKPDLVAQEASTGRIAILTVDGPKIKRSFPVYPVPPPGWAVVGTGDFDGDGFSDIIVQNTTTYAISVLIVQNFKTVASIPIHPNVPVGWRVVGAADYDGNTWPDILVENETTRELSVLRMSGKTILESKPILPTILEGWFVAGPK